MKNKLKPRSPLKFAVIMVLVVGCSAHNGDPQQQVATQQSGRASKFPMIPAELKPGLIALRLGDKSHETHSVFNRNHDQLESWLAIALIRGQTTKKDVIALFGPHTEESIRQWPGIDASMQYYLGSHANFTIFNFAFEPESEVLVEWSVQGGIE